MRATAICVTNNAIVLPAANAAPAPLVSLLLV